MTNVTNHPKPIIYWEIIINQKVEFSHTSNVEESDTPTIPRLNYIVITQALLTIITNKLHYNPHHCIQIWTPHRKVFRTILNENKRFHIQNTRIIDDCELIMKIGDQLKKNRNYRLRWCNTYKLRQNHPFYRIYNPQFIYPNT
jgi:hypothetical protein